MRNTVAIMQRELLSLFFSPIGYIVVTGFLLITGVLVMDSFGPGPSVRSTAAARSRR